MAEAVEALGRITLVDQPIQGKPLPAHYMPNARISWPATVRGALGRLVTPTKLRRLLRCHR
mgnify:CR=1 FL=1